MKSLQCVHCALIVQIILNYQLGLLKNIHEKIDGIWLKYLSPSKGFFFARVHWYTGTQVHWYTGTLVHRYTGTLVHWYTGTMNIVSLH
jgi:hypothetical protein